MKTPDPYVNPDVQASASWALGDIGPTAEIEIPDGTSKGYLDAEECRELASTLLSLASWLESGPTR